MNKDFKKFIIVLIASYFIFRFYFNFVSTTFQQVLLFGFLGAYWVIYYPRLVGYIRNLGNLKLIFSVIVLMHISVLSAAFFTPLVYGTNDFSYFTSNLRSFSYTLSYVVLIDLVKVHLKPADITKSFMDIFIYSSTLYVTFSILTLVFPPLRSFWLSVIIESERNIHLLQNNPSYIARFGWTGFSSFVVTFFVSIAVVFSLFLLLRSVKNNQKIEMKYLFTLVLLLIGNSFYGRVGLFNSLALIGMSFLYILFRSKKKHYAVFLVGGSGLTFLLFSIVQNFVPQMQQWYSWIMDPIINLVTTGSLNTTSTDHLFSMYFMPNVRTFLFGDGFYRGTMGNSYYMSVDVGFLRPMLFYGVFFLIIGYSISVFLAFALCHKKKENLLLTLMLVFSLFVFEFKGEVTLTITPILYALFLAEAESRRNCILTQHHTLNLRSNNRFATLDNYNGNLKQNDLSI